MNSKRAYHVILLMLMLSMQSAVALHSVEHEVFEHTELCTAYLSAEKISALEITAPLLMDCSFATHTNSYTKQHYFSESSTVYASRAPPLN